MPGSGPRLLRRLLFGATVAWGVIFLVLVALAQRRDVADPMVEVMVGKVRLLVEVAATPAERARGLMGRRRLLPGHGMLFVFPQPDRSRFWMKDTRIPLDIIWVSAEQRVVHLAEGVLPCPSTSLGGAGSPGRAESCPTVEPPLPALYVIEAEAGFARRAGVTVGSPVTLPNVSAAH